MSVQRRVKERVENIHSQRLAADGVEVGQLDEVVVRHVPAVPDDLARLRELVPQLRLHVRVLREEVQDARERVRRRVHPREDECPDEGRGGGLVFA